MDKKETLYKKIIEGMFTPSLVKFLTIKKMGVLNFLNNILPELDTFDPTTTQAIDLAYVADKKTFIEYIETFNFAFDIGNSIKKIAKSKHIKSIAKHFSDDFVKQAMLSQSDSRINELIHHLENQIIPIIEEDIKKQDYAKYFKFDSQENLIKLIYERLTIEQIISILIDTTCNHTYYLEKYAKKDIKNYIDNIYNNNKDISDFLLACNSTDKYDLFLKDIKLSTYDIKKIIENASTNTRLLDYTLDKYQEDSIVIFDEYIKNDKIYELLEKLFFSNIGPMLVAPRLTKDQIVQILKENKNSDFYFVPTFFKKSKDLVLEYIIDEFKSNRLNIDEYYNILSMAEIYDDVIKGMELSFEGIKDKLTHNFNKYFHILLKTYENKTISVLEEIRKENPLFFEKVYDCYDADATKKIIKNLTETEIKQILSNAHINNAVKDEVYEDNKKYVMNFIFNEATEEELYKFFKYSPCDKLRQELLKKYPIEKIIKYSVYYCGEVEDLYTNRKKEFQEYILEGIKTNHFKVFCEILRMMLYEITTIGKFLIDNLSDDQLIDCIVNKNTWEYLNRLPKEFKTRLISILKNNSDELIHQDFSKYVLLLKSIRKLDEELSTITFESITLEDSLLTKLYTERGLSDSQKDILYNMYSERIKESINNLNHDELFEFIQKGTKEEILDIIINKYGKKNVKELLYDNEFISRRSIGMKFAINLAYKCNDNIDTKEIKKYVDAYNYNKIKFINNYFKVNTLLKLCHIIPEDFLQVMLNNSYNFLDDAIYIHDNHINEFILLYEKFKTSDAFNIESYDSLLLLFKNFIRYESLCLSIIKNEEDDLSDVVLLFKRDETLENKPNTIKDCQNINELIQNNMKKMYDECKDIEDYKNVICLALFNKKYQEMKKSLRTYGGLKELLALKHYNNTNPLVLTKIEDLESYVAIIEDIVDCDNIDDLKEVSLNIIDNISYLLRDNNLANYFDKIRELYALELSSNLTQIKSKESIDSIINNDLTKEYGVPVYNVSDKKYCILAHVISERERIEDLMNGLSNGYSNFISFSAISHRKQSYYYGAKNTIIGYDNIPKENYVFGSKDNLGSNGAISNNSIEIDSEKIALLQRGVLEISDTSGNSEVLCYRKNLVPRYIILPGQRRPNEYELELAKKYNLILLQTQEKNTKIHNPKDIAGLYKEKSIEYKRLELLNMKAQLLSVKKLFNRKIAIITDAHALLEPTIAVLESIRKEGITEIYSLGDNIGTGPNPSSVVDLLNMYNVKSIKGNHEHYLIDGTDTFKDHLIRTNAYEEETINSLWNKENLREDQIEEIKNYPEDITLTIHNKKILLTHYIYDYNTEKIKYNLDEYDDILMGHKHFENTKDNIVTVKAIGIGNDSIAYEGKASYVVIEENDDAINISKVMVPYNIDNTLNEINITDVNTKDKMRKWVRRV